MIKNEYKVKQYYALMLVLFSVLILLISEFTYGLASVHSDSAAELMGVKCLLSNHALFPHEWVYGNGDINLMRTQIFILLPFLLTKNWAISRVVGAVSQWVLTILCLWLLGKNLKNNFSILFSAPFLILYLTGEQVRDVGLFNTMYISALLYSTLILTLFLRARETKQVKIAVIYIILLFLVSVGGIRWQIEITIPLVIAIIFEIILEDISIIKSKGKQLVYTLLSIIVPSMLGGVYYLYIKHTRSFIVTPEDDLVLAESINQVGSNFIEAIGNLFKIFGYRGGADVFSLSGIVSLSSICICILICFIIPILQIKKFNNESDSVKFIIVFAIAHNLILFFVAVLTSKTYYYYHLITVVYWFVVISARYIYEYLLFNLKIFSFLLACLILCLSFFYMADLINHNRDWKKRYDTLTAISQEMLSKNIGKCYGGLWNSYIWEVYTNGKTEAGTVNVSNDGLWAAYLLVDENVFKHQSTNSCLILTTEEVEQYGDKLKALCGTPVEEEIKRVPSWDFDERAWVEDDNHFWFFDYDVASKINNGAYDGIINNAETVFNGNGVRDDDQTVMENLGRLYSRVGLLQKGNYIIKIKGDNVDYIGYDIFSGYSDDEFQYIEIERNPNEVIVELDLKKASDGLNITLKNDSEYQIQFNEMTIERKRR